MALDTIIEINQVSIFQKQSLILANISLFIDKGELRVGIEKMLHQIDQPNGDTASPPPAMPSRLDERELALSADYDWALEDAELPKTYGGQVVAVSNRRVWGAGRTRTQARNAAKEAGCPDSEDLALVPISRLSL